MRDARACAQVGVPAFIKAAAASVERDMAISDAVVLPVAIAMLGYMLRSPRLLLLPVLSVGACTAVAFGAMCARAPRAWREFDLVCRYPSSILPVSAAGCVSLWWWLTLSVSLYARARRRVRT